jgi:cytidylate kinase
MTRFHSLKAIGSYLGAQARSREATVARKPRPVASRFVTISRQAGAGGTSVAVALAGLFNRERSEVPWTVFDRELVGEVIRQHDLPGEVAKYLEEDAVPELQTIVTELFGGVTARKGLVAKTSRTILHLARMGNAIIVGRGASVVTARLSGGFHVRLIGSKNVRTARLMKITGKDRSTARALLRRRDQGRVKYLRQYFKADVEDPQLYDLVMNTDRIEYARAARLVLEAMNG